MLSGETVVNVEKLMLLNVRLIKSLLRTMRRYYLLLVIYIYIYMLDDATQTYLLFLLVVVFKN